MSKKIYKIFVAGLPDAGKTTFVKTCSQISPLITDVSSKNRKTTVAFDFGLIKIDEKREIHVYGTPGQERFSFMWEIIQKGALGYIYLIPAYGYELIQVLSHFNQVRNIAKIPSVIGITKTDLSANNSNIVFQVAQAFNVSEKDIFTLDPRVKADVKSALERIVKKVIENYEEKLVY